MASSSALAAIGFASRLRPDFGEKRSELLRRRQGRDAPAQGPEEPVRPQPGTKPSYASRDHLLASGWIDVVRQDRVGDLADAPGQVDG